jgi:2,3-dihydroxybenzoate-AMP ligase
MLPGCVAWPEEFAARYRREGYWQGETLGDLLRRSAKIHRNRTALVSEVSTWTYSELDARADRLAAGLCRLGLRPADRVVVQLPNLPELVALCYALFRLGALPIFALPAHRRSEITYMCEHSQAVAYVIPDRYQGFDYRVLAREVRSRVPTLAHILVAGMPGEFLSLNDVDAEPVQLPPPLPSDVAFFLLSGGTTGLPKLIPRTHDDYAYQTRATAEALAIDCTSTYLTALSISHNPALGCPGVLGTLHVGGKVVLSLSPSPDEVFPLIAREGVTLTTLMPSLVQLWMEAAALSKVDMANLLLQVGGAMFHPDVANRVRPTLKCRLTHWFGMAEGLLTYTRLDDAEDIAVFTQGRPLSPADEIRVVDDMDRDVAPGEVGQLVARGPYTLRGYYKALERNGAAFTSDGYFRTGDLVKINPDGNLIVEGRVKDVINRGGEKVSAEELEGQLIAHPGIRDASVVAMPDDLMGEKTCAFIIPSTVELTLREVSQFLRDRGVASYKCPDRLEFVDSFPHTNLGKVSKVDLRGLIAQKLGKMNRNVNTQSSV